MTLSPHTQPARAPTWIDTAKRGAVVALETVGRIVLGDRPEPVLADFGLARPVTDAQARVLVRLLEAGAVHARLAYVSQADEAAPLAVLERLGLVHRAEEALPLKSGFGQHLIPVWWLHPRGAALAAALQRRAIRTREAATHAEAGLVSPKPGRAKAGP